MPTRREHSSHLSARISGLVTSRANLLQRSVTLHSPAVPVPLALGCLVGVGSARPAADHSGRVNEWRQRPSVEPLPFKVATLHGFQIDTSLLQTREPLRSAALASPSNLSKVCAVFRCRFSRPLELSIKRHKGGAETWRTTIKRRAEHPLRSRFEKPPEHDAQSLPHSPVIPRNEAFCL